MTPPHEGHTAHRLQTTLNAAQEELVIYLRPQLSLPLDDLLAVVLELIKPAMNCLIAALARAVSPKPETVQAFELGYVHVKYLPQIQGEGKRRDVLVTVADATRRVLITVKPHKSAAAAKAFFAAVRKATPFKIRTISLWTAAKSSQTGCLEVLAVIPQASTNQ